MEIWKLIFYSIAMRNKILTALVLLLAAGGGLFGAWRTEVAVYLGSAEYREAGGLLLSNYQSLEAVDRPEASALLAFIFKKQGEANSERRWLLEYFETQAGANTDFSFLDIAVEGEVTAFLNGWRMKYPRLSGVYLVTHKGENFLSAPADLVIGLEAPVEILYKFSDEKGPRQGGLLHRGLNLIALEAEGLFNASGTHVLTLDFKSGDIQLRKELALEVRLSAEPASAGQPRPMDLEYSLKMFVGGNQVASSRKTGRDKNPLDLNIPPVNLRANPMFKPPHSNDPFDPDNRGVSILDAINVAYGLLKDLFKNKQEPYQSSIEKQTSVTYTYFQGSPEGSGENQVSAVIMLRARPARML
jgi:hypothetical protein